MAHRIYRVVALRVVGPHSVHVEFDDGIAREIDPEAHTLAWPNGADLDPETPRDWPDRRTEMEDLARRWAEARSPP